MMNNIQEILKLLPHRYPFLLVDRITEFEPNDYLVAVKNVTVNEPCFTGHFPEQPVLPGVLQLESMAQATALLAFKTLEATGRELKENGIFLFAGIDKARFKMPVMPGDQMLIHCKLLREKSGMWKAEAKITVDGKLACFAELLAAYRDV